mgnify:CR=1 FL=1
MKKRILLTYATYGNGHRAIAEYIKSYFEAQDSELEILLVPKDPNDDKNVIVEIRGGAGGDEANIFAGDLARMYLKLADQKGWQTQIHWSPDQRKIEPRHSRTMGLLKSEFN